MKLSAEFHAFKPALVHGRDDQLRGNPGDRGEEFPQIIHIQLRRRIIQQEARGRSPEGRLECELTEDEGRCDQFLLASGYSISGRRSLEEKRDVGPMSTDGGCPEPLISGTGFDQGLA